MAGLPLLRKSDRDLTSVDTVSSGPGRTQDAFLVPQPAWAVFLPHVSAPQQELVRMTLHRSVQVGIIERPYVLATLQKEGSVFMQRDTLVLVSKLQI